jgi:hypothetical protein
MYSPITFQLAQARQQDFLREADRRPRRETEAQPAEAPSRRDESPRWFRFPKLAGSRA